MQERDTLPLQGVCVFVACCLLATPLAAQFIDVELSLSRDLAAERDDAAVTLKATLGQAVDSDVEIELEFSGTATQDLDYFAESSTIEIEAGDLEGSVLITPIWDWNLEIGETINIGIDSMSGAPNLQAGDDVEVEIDDEGAIPIQKSAIGTKLFLLAYFNYTDSAIEVNTVVFNLGGVNSSSTTLVARLHENFEELMDSDPLFETSVPALERNGLYNYQFQIDLDDLDPGFHHLVLSIDSVSEELYAGDPLTVVHEGFELDGNRNAVVQCRGPARSGTSGVPDPLFPHQWHLINEDSTLPDWAAIPGNDLGLNEVVRVGEPTGRDVVVAVVDTGLEICHPDLVNSVEEGKSYNLTASNDAENSWFGAVKEDPYLPTTYGDHGTSVAGVIAATADNGIGGRGVAPNVKLRGFNFLVSHTDVLLADVLGASETDPSSSDVDVFNMSFGSMQSGHSNSREDDINTLKHGVTNLRDGKGALYVKAAGNGFQDCFAYLHAVVSAVGCMGTNVDPIQNTPYLINVGALAATGKRASYSSAGSDLWVSAPAGEYVGQFFPMTITTDQFGNDRGYDHFSGLEDVHAAIPHGDYTTDFAGTSSAAPHVSGVVALMLEREPDLTWRDVKHVLANTARKTDPDIPWAKAALGGSTAVLRHGWITNAAGYSFHNWYGFGAVDADDALSYMDTFTPNQLGEFVESDWHVHEESESIPDYEGTGLEQTQSVDVGQQAANIEGVQLRIHMDHPFPAETSIHLVSPSGTESVMNELLNNVLVGDTELDWILLSNAFYGENPNGEWKIRVIDAGEGGEGTLDKWQLRFFYGDHSEPSSE